MFACLLMHHWFNCWHALVEYGRSWVRSLGRVKPKTIKYLLVVSLLSRQH